MDQGETLSFVQIYYIELLALLPALIMLIGLTAAVRSDSYIQNRQQKHMLVICVLAFSLVVQNYLDYLLTIGRPMIMLRTIVDIYGYAIRPVILLLFLRIVQPDKKMTLNWLLVLVNALVYMTALFSRSCFWIDKNNIYRSGLPVLRNFCLISSVILLVQLLVSTIRYYRPLIRREAFTLYFSINVIFLALFLDYWVRTTPQPITFLTIAIVIICVMFYIWLHMKFVRDHEQALVADQRMQIMLSQIQPHFLYNSLSVIQNLCHKDPGQAEAATIHFARYLRGNMDSLFSESMISFAQELKHTQEYLALEKMRFGDKLEVCYDTPCTIFELPPLTLQPIVENAVRHGVRSNPEGAGIVTIATRELPQEYQIIVTDNGSGFDPGQPPEKKEHSHIGIQNVRERLQKICGGKLDYLPSAGKGTVAVISLPKEAKRG